MKNIILNILDYLRFQVENDKCTAEELKSVHDAVLQNIEVDASIKDIAEYYGKTEVNVSTVISRRLSKPKRRVYYDFRWFSKIMPKNWTKAK